MRIDVIEHDDDHECDLRELIYCKKLHVSDKWEETSKISVSFLTYAVV